jgi:hypothetical protein
MVDQAEVHPDGPWPVARTATVMFGEGTYKNVPIIRIGMTPANLTVRKESYVRGAVILNEIPPPENQEPITLPVMMSREDIPVDVQENGGWPAGVITLFMK